MDLSLRTTSSPPPKNGDGLVPIVRPVPRPPWSILWYQNLWSLNNNSIDEGSGAVRNDEIRHHSDCSSAQFPPPYQHNNRLYRLSMSAFTSERCYPSSCHQQYKETLEAQREPHFKNIFESSNEDDGGGESENDNDSETSDSIVVTTSTSGENGVRPGPKSDSNSISLLGHNHPHATVVLDIACCDGPVQFKRISNPNFAVTVEHNEVSPSMDTTTSTMSMFPSTSKGHSSSSSNIPSVTGLLLSPGRKYMQPTRQSQVHSPKCGTQWTVTNDDGHASPPHSSSSGNHSTLASTLKSYLCIYCNQSFKSLFCYQKHKKRHLNPVSVDITTTIPSNSTSLREPSGPRSSKRAGSGNTSAGRGVREERRQGGGSGVSGTIGLLPDSTKAKTKDLNVQFFPCKKCGCKFPSYYFVHKHRKICH